MKIQNRNCQIFLTPLILSICTYIFFGNLLASYNHIWKVINVIAFGALATLYLSSIIIKNSISKTSFWGSCLLIFIASFFTLMALQKKDGSEAEFSIFISILLARILIEDKKLFLKILKIVLYIQLIMVVYEFASQAYIYETVSVGLTDEQLRTINIKSYGDVGHRPKGLFSGPLEATSFYIFCCIIFFRKIDVVLLVLLLSALSNGRLAIVVSLVILVNYHFFKKISLKQILVICTAILAIAIMGLIQSDRLSYWISAASLESPSNVGRLIWFATGLKELSSFDLNEALIGKGLYFNEKYQHSAESGVLNQALIHGIPWAIFVLILLFHKTFNRETALIYLLVIACFLIYRLEAGFMRATLLWFLLLQRNKKMRKI